MVTTWLYRENSLFINPSLSLRCNMKGKTPKKTELEVTRDQGSYGYAAIWWQVEVKATNLNLFFFYPDNWNGKRLNKTAGRKITLNEQIWNNSVC